MSEIPDRPKLRKDLVVVQREDEEGSFFVVKDPRLGRYFRVGKDEKMVMDLLDGTRSIADIEKELTGRAEIEYSEIQKFLSMLEKNFLLETSLNVIPENPDIKHKFSIFEIKIKLFNPEKLLNFIGKYTGWFTGKTAFVFYLTIIFGGFLVCIFHPDYLIEGFRVEVFTGPRLILLFYVVTSILMTFHEFGHAIFCHKYGGDVKEMGFMLLYFIPCLYTDISDIHLLKRRRQAMMVIVAGPMVELTIWSLSVLGYFLFNGRGVISTVLYVTVLASGVKSIFINFNPFIRTDGYFLLEELFGIDNLMQKSRKLTKSFFFGRKNSDEIDEINDDLNSVTATKKVLLVCYFFLSIIYVISLLLFSLFYFSKLVHH